MAGLMFSTAVPIFVESTYILPPPGPLTAELVDQVHINAGVEFSIIPPSIVAQLTNNAEHLDNLKKLKGLNFAGGPLPFEIGEILKRYTTLHNTIGATEYFTLPFLPKERDDWAWLKFDRHYAGIDFRATDEGLYEMVIVRDERLDLLQAAFVTFPDIEEYRTKDLFAPHPFKPDLWQYRGRLDDIIVFSNGEKFNPTTAEGIILASPYLKGCLIGGTGQFQTVLILEPLVFPTSDSDTSQLIDHVWPLVNQANKNGVKQGHVTRDRILVSTPDKPLPRAGKGTIQRRAAYKLYVEEIEEISKQKGGNKSNDESAVTLSLREPRNALKSLQTFISDELGLEGIELADDFFEAGMDSLQLISLVRMINTSQPPRSVDASNIYDHPSILSLVKFIHADRDEGYDSDDDIETWTKMRSLYEDVASNLPGEKRVTPMRRFLSSTNNVFVPPDGGTSAWLQVLACFLINLNNWGIVNSFGVFQVYYENNLLSNKSASTISWIGTLQGALLLIVGVISGPLFDKGYFKGTVLVASIALSFSYMMLSLADTYWQIMLCQGVLAGFCTGLLFIPSIALVSLYFTVRRAFALGLATSGGAIGGIIYPIIFQRLLVQVGFAWATRTIGFIILATLLAATIMLKPVNSGNNPMRQYLDLGALREVPFVAFMLAAFLLYCAILVPFFLAGTFAQQRLGTSDNLSFYMIVILNAGQFIGRIVPPTLTDHLGPELLLLVAETAVVILAFSWTAISSTPGFIVWSAVYGIGTGAISTLSAAVLPYLCPSLGVLGTRFGMVYAMAGLGVLISVPVATAIEGTATNVFLGTQLWTGIAATVGTGFYVVAFVEARRRRRMMEQGRSRRGVFQRRRRTGGKLTP